MIFIKKLKNILLLLIKKLKKKYILLFSIRKLKPVLLLPIRKLKPVLLLPIRKLKPVLLIPVILYLPKNYEVTYNLFIGDLFNKLHILTQTSELTLNYKTDHYLEYDFEIFRYKFIHFEDVDILYEYLSYIYNFLLFKIIVNFIFENRFLFKRVCITYILNFKKEEQIFHTQTKNMFINISEIKLRYVIETFIPFIKNQIEKYNPSSFISVEITLICHR